MDPTVIPPSVGTNDQVVAGDIPASRLGLQPRPALLTQLSRLSQGSPLVLTGTRGAGKTQLAAAYARAKLADRWRLIAWVDARDSETLLAGLAAVADAAGLPVGGSRPGAADAGRAVRHWLETDGNRRLLVFDGVEDPGLLRPFVPAAGASRVLITAAREQAAELGTRVPVGVFSGEEALALLDGRTGLADEAGASAVATELGYLPLALDHAAAVIAEQHLDYAAYLATLRALPDGDDLAPGEDDEQQPLPPGAAKAVLLSMEAASAADRLGVCAGVMELMAMLSPAVAGPDLLRAAGQTGTLLGSGRRVAASMVDQALERLAERSLLGFRLDHQAVTMHCLVARVVRGWLVRQGRLARACRAAASASADSAVALAQSRDHAAVSEMLGQVTALLENAGAGPADADETLARMLMRLRFLALDARNRLATAYADAGRVAEAIPLLEQTLAGRERLLGPDNPDTMRSRNDLARAYREAGRVADAVPLIERVLAARERLYGADHSSTIATRNNLASAYRATGWPADAIPLFEQNVSACERLLGADHPKTLASRHNLDRARRESAQAERRGRRPQRVKGRPGGR